MKEFLQKYDDGSFRFSGVRFRDGAEWTLPFQVFVESAGDYKRHGLWFNDGRLVYIHFGVDRAHGGIICPFDSHAEWHEGVPGYETLLILKPVGADFEIRIAHMDRPSHPVRAAILNGGIIKAGVFLGKTGARGIGTGPHSHTEIVSIGETSAICDTILEARGFSKENKMADYEKKMNNEEREYFRNYLSARGFVLFSDHVCIRDDGFRPVGRVTYYSSRSLFGM